MGMKLNIFSIGQNKNQAIKSLEQEYLKRLSRFVKINAQEFKTEDKLVSFLKNNKYYLIGLEENGKVMDSKSFSAWLNKTMQHEKEIAFVIADESGFSADLKNTFNFRLSLSPLTFPHEIARLLLCEQVYRAFTIINHHPYHK
jgi:23S rRNA (pseudouridine1915-N3)-methyltransferase